MNNILAKEDEWGDIQQSVDFFYKHIDQKELSILDIGCNYGSFAFCIYNKGFKNIVGLDIDEDKITKGKEFYKDISDKLILGSHKSLPFNDNEFDVVTMFDVIEHIEDIDTYLKDQVFRVLKPGGLFIFQTPNKYINIPWEILKQRSLTEYKKYHVALQSYSSLKMILDKSGFKDIHIVKGDVFSDYNTMKVKRALGSIGVFFLRILNIMPVRMSSNFWGTCIKKNRS